MYPDVWAIMIQHPVQSLYLGCWPMGLTTILNIAVGLIYKEYGIGGTGFLYAIWGIWWMDVAVSVFCCWVTVHVM